MEKVLKIMLLEDHEEDAELINRCLRKANMAFEAIRVDTREEFIEGLQSFNPDVILSDHSLPQFNSIQALKICRATEEDIPFILVTGTVSEEFAVSCLKEGADDYVLKSNLTRLPNAISNSLQQRWYESNRKQQKEALKQQNYQLAKMNKELDAFVYSLSHSLRSPLSTILGVLYIARLENEPDMKSVKNYFDMIEKNIISLDNTLRSILHYSMNTKNDTEIKPINLKQLFYDVFDQIESSQQEKRLQKHITIKNQETIYSDVYRLTIILNNLLWNAYLFSRDNSSDSFVAIEAIVYPEKVFLNIQDNGIGIHPKYQDKIFDMFYRASYKSEGAGLGLYIVKEMVEKLKGSITLESEPTVGSLFKLCIPNHTPHT